MRVGGANGVGGAVPNFLLRPRDWHSKPGLAGDHELPGILVNGSALALLSRDDG